MLQQQFFSPGNSEEKEAFLKHSVDRLRWAKGARACLGKALMLPLCRQESSRARQEMAEDDMAWRVPPSASLFRLTIATKDQGSRAGRTKERRCI